MRNEQTKSQTFIMRKSNSQLTLLPNYSSRSSEKKLSSVSYEKPFEPLKPIQRSSNKKLTQKEIKDIKIYNKKMDHRRSISNFALLVRNPVDIMGNSLESHNEFLKEIDKKFSKFSERLKRSDYIDKIFSLNDSRSQALEMFSSYFSPEMYVQIRERYNDLFGKDNLLRRMKALKFKRNKFNASVRDDFCDIPSKFKQDVERVKIKMPFFSEMLLQSSAKKKYKQFDRLSKTNNSSIELLSSKNRSKSVLFEKDIFDLSKQTEKIKNKMICLRKKKFLNFPKNLSQSMQSEEKKKMIFSLGTLKPKDNSRNKIKKLKKDLHISLK